ncbi:nuclear pore complex protein NUP96 isoform X1 [Telopea speciosissima]|uniref:nuclear pore complex protein NUP96 isoform X1 n=1 Tax=Telopea speciosissima TaxID=54955 RepID=UPI001CC69118|nr:nuclear pore complex protein NUP96 isoform X1 [Telopea speciosissima]
MASTSSAHAPGIYDELCGVRNSVSFETYYCSKFDSGTLSLYLPSQCKKGKISVDMYNPSCWALSDIKASFPVLHSSDYFMEPSLLDLDAQELNDPGHCCRVRNFTVGRVGYGWVKFLGETDVRWLELDQIVKFDRHEVVVYEDETDKPAIGEGLNKAAEVTLVLQIKPLSDERVKLDSIAEKLKIITEKQGACFISFDPLNGEWKFLVRHFSRFGLSEDDEDDIIMDEATAAQHPEEVDGGEPCEVDEEPQIGPDGAVLSHSLPAHLGLDPIKMQEMRMVMFPVEEGETEDFDGLFSREKQSFSREYGRPSLQYSSRKMSHRVSPPIVRKTPQSLLEYNIKGSDQPGTILMARQNLGIAPRTTKVRGFQLDLKHETPVTGHHSRYVVDAGLFMGRSFRVGWGPNGVLVHCGSPVGSTGPGVLSSIVNVEKVAINKVVRDENNKVKEELIDCCFASPLSLHKSISHETMEVEVGSFRLKLQKVVSNRLVLPEICRSYIDIIEKQLDVPCLSASARGVLMHQVMVWELIKVLFSVREVSGHSTPVDVDDEEDMLGDKKDGSPDIDPEALPFVRRAQFSYWLQESVCHRVQEEISCLNESRDLEHIFLLLTGRQLDVAVELSASRGDVRLACLLSQAGGSTVNRSDMARQLDLWRTNGLDFNFIEKDRLRLYELLAGNIQGALQDSVIDWKRYLGLLMWYQLPPDTSLAGIIHTYQQLLDAGKAPYPIPVYIDEGLVEEAVNWSVGDRFDLAYYLMLLHASEESEFGLLKTMFSAFSSTCDALDYHMLWHQRSVLEAVGAFCSNDLHVLDMSFVSQLLCLGQCHWAIYVVLHMPYRDDFPYLQATLIREILFQYCESWSSQEIQHRFIKDLGVPSAWLHEAMAVYFHYQGDLLKALEHFLECSNWQKAHSIFVTSVAHSLFLSAKHSEICRLAVSMEEHKSEIADWDLGAGIYISFYIIKNTIRDGAMYDLESLERNKASCREFFGRLNESLAVWGSRLPADARATYSEMAEELCAILILDGGEASTYEDQLSCFETMFNAPIPEDLREGHLQDAVSVFTCYLTEMAS